MNDFYKSAAVVIAGIILCIALSGNKKEFSTMTVIIICCFLGINIIQYLKPMITFFRKLQDLSGIDNQVFSILLKAVGIGLLGEFTTLICLDAGYSAMGKTFQILSSVIILWLALPLFESLLELVERLMVNP